MRYNRKDIKSVYAEYRRISALVTPIIAIEESLATSLALARCAGAPTTTLEANASLASVWLETGLKYYDAVRWDLDRLIEDLYDGTLPAWVKENYVG